MKTDRELLELAAKAAGLGVKWEQAHSCFWIEMGQGLPINHWNPLADDGDAFRLMVRLSLFGSAEVERHRTIAHICECCLDGAAVYRRAIVRASAAIQEAKEAN